MVSTLSMCAYVDPIRVLQQMNRWFADHGRILLLEHGKSSVLPIAWLQDLFDPLQVRTIGCHTNRDILGLVSRSPLIIEQHESHLFGMIHLIWAKPSRKEGGSEPRRTRYRVLGRDILCLGHHKLIFTLMIWKYREHFTK